MLRSGNNGNRTQIPQEVTCRGPFKNKCQINCHSYEEKVQIQTETSSQYNMNGIPFSEE